jgi:hypothetical protein
MPENDQCTKYGFKAVRRTAKIGNDCARLVDPEISLATRHTPLSAMITPTPPKSFALTIQPKPDECTVARSMTQSGAVSPLTTRPLNEKPRPSERLRANSRWMKASSSI